MVYFLTRRRPPCSTLTDTRVPSTTLFRSRCAVRTLCREQRLHPGLYLPGRLPDFGKPFSRARRGARTRMARRAPFWWRLCRDAAPVARTLRRGGGRRGRSEEHTSELQSLMRISYAVFCLKKTNMRTRHNKIVIHDNSEN